LLDYALFADAKRNRVLQNIGGISNLTAIAAGASVDQIIAFDNGPGNMIIDALTMQLFQKPFDKNGKIAASGKVIEPVLHSALLNPYLALKPPRTAGREQFGHEYARQFLLQCQKHSQKPADALATATALTATAIARSYRQFVHRKMKRDTANQREVDYIVSGGGARNRTLMAMLAEQLAAMSCEVTTSEAFGLPAEAKEAAAFALLAFQTWNHQTANVPSATGARRAVLLGQVTYAD
jgi:anhydro-N-acetylmuramic acid kinase